MIVEDIARVVALVVFVVFIVAYALLARWWRDPVGRNLMSMMLVVAGLMAKGVTEIYEPEYIDRGYEHIEQKLRSLGADIKREKV